MTTLLYNSTKKHYWLIIDNNFKNCIILYIIFKNYYENTRLQKAQGSKREPRLLALIVRQFCGERFILNRKI